MLRPKNRDCFIPTTHQSADKSIISLFGVECKAWRSRTRECMRPDSDPLITGSGKCPVTSPGHAKTKGDFTMNNSTNEIKTAKIPILNIRMMSDEEWNKLAYKNFLERRCYV